MDSGILTVRTIFGQQRRNLVPLYQRPYVWTQEDQWDPLWNDLRLLAERLLEGKDTRPHFLGAIVLDQVLKQTGYVESRWVIDGQQRLTTMQIILEAFSDLCQQYEVANQASALLALTQNQNPMQEPDEVKFKVWPTNSDRDAFRTVMLAKSAAEVRASFGCRPDALSVGQAIPDAYLFFHDVMAEWLAHGSPNFEERLNVLFKAIPDFVKMVVIDLGPDDDAQLIFETLNARGTPLLPVDLVKNYLFHKAQLQNLPMETLYDAYWRPFDEDAKYWRKDIGIGHNARPRIDAFLQQYLTLKRRDEIGKAHLYGTYCDLVEDNGGDPEPHMKELASYAKVFRAFDQPVAGSRAALFFQRLNAMDITAAHPFLLELFARFSSADKYLHETLTWIESFLVRRMICQLSARSYNRLFIDLIAALDGPAEGLSRRVFDGLASHEAESNRWPRSREFEAAWSMYPIYRTLKRQRVVMILNALELYLHDPKSESVTFGKPLSIEHLLPQSWKTDHWPLLGRNEPTTETEERDQRLHTIGNLTLLRQKLNSSVSNGPYVSKRAAILKHSALNLNRPLLDWNAWDEDSIAERSEQLFDAAQKIWPAPAE